MELSIRSCCVKRGSRLGNGSRGERDPTQEPGRFWICSTIDERRKRRTSDIRLGSLQKASDQDFTILGFLLRFESRGFLTGKRTPQYCCSSGRIVELGSKGAQDQFAPKFPAWLPRKALGELSRLGQLIPRYVVAPRAAQASPRGRNPWRVLAARPARLCRAHHFGSGRGQGGRDPPAAMQAVPAARKERSQGRRGPVVPLRGRTSVVASASSGAAFNRTRARSACADPVTIPVGRGTSCYQVWAGPPPLPRQNRTYSYEDDQKQHEPSFQGSSWQNSSAYLLTLRQSTIGPSISSSRSGDWVVKLGRLLRTCARAARASCAESEFHQNFPGAFSGYSQLEDKVLERIRTPLTIVLGSATIGFLRFSWRQITGCTRFAQLPSIQRLTLRGQLWFESGSFQNGTRHLKFPIKRIILLSVSIQSILATRLCSAS